MHKLSCMQGVDILNSHYDCCSILNLFYLLLINENISQEPELHNGVDTYKREHGGHSST